MRDITEDQNIAELLLHQDVNELLRLTPSTVNSGVPSLFTVLTPVVFDFGSLHTTHKNKEYWRGVEIEMENENAYVDPKDYK